MTGRPHRPVALGALLLAALLPAGLPAAAQEPLFLRIRPQDAPPREVGTGPSEADVAAARAAREAVWARSAVRARIAIASICTGCLKPLPTAPLTPDRALTGPAPSANEPASDPTPALPADPALPTPVLPTPVLPTRGDP